MSIFDVFRYSVVWHFLYYPQNPQVYSEIASLHIAKKGGHKKEIHFHVQVVFCLSCQYVWKCKVFHYPFRVGTYSVHRSNGNGHKWNDFAKKKLWTWLFFLQNVSFRKCVCPVIWFYIKLELLYYLLRYLGEVLLPFIWLSLASYLCQINLFHNIFFPLYRNVHRRRRNGEEGG